MKRPDRRSNRGRLRPSRARYKERYFSGRVVRPGGWATRNPEWVLLRYEPFRHFNCRRGPELTQLRRLEQKKVRREGKSLIAEELEWMAYERLLLGVFGQQSRRGALIERDLETLMSYTLSASERVDSEWQYMEDMLMYDLEREATFEDDEEEALHNAISQWVDSYSSEEDDEDDEDDEEFEGEEEFFAPPRTYHLPELPHAQRQRERLKASTRQHYPYRRR